MTGDPTTAVSQAKTITASDIALAWLMVFAWMAVIYWFSDHPYSGAHTQKLFGPLNIPVRKIAHLSEYAILFWLTFRALARTASLNLAPEFLSGRAFAAFGLGALFVCVAYALSDEWHQAYVPGRSATVEDVLFDTTGASTGWLAAFLVRLRQKGRS